MGIFSSIFGSLFDDTSAVDIGGTCTGSDALISTNEFDSRPAVNIDGTPMLGDFDINGNAYGVTEIDHGTNDALSSDTTSLDIGGDSSLFDTSSSFATDDSSSSMSISSEDSFSSSFSSDDSFGSDTFSSDSFSSSWDD